MDINLTIMVLGHAVELHLCLGGGKVVSGREAEHVELSSEPEHQLGFQPNREDHDDEEDDDDTGSRRAGTRTGRLQQRAVGAIRRNKKLARR